MRVVGLLPEYSRQSELVDNQRRPTTTYLPAADIPDPREFLRVVSRHWRSATEAMESGNPPAELTIGAAKDWPTIIPILRCRAATLDYWANEDEAWEE